MNTRIFAANEAEGSNEEKAKESKIEEKKAGPPQYEKHSGVLKEAEIVGDGSVMLHIDFSGDKGSGLIKYEPGHVLALEIEYPVDKIKNAKNAADTAQNDGWMRGPYTVSRCNEDTLDILIKVVGDKSKAFAEAIPGTPIRFGGKFHVPIVEGITPKADRLVMLSTGVGIGPCVGAVEKLLSESSFPGQIDLYASFRYESERLYGDYLNVWSTAYENFRYKPLITSEVGRISATEENLQWIADATICPVANTHYHLIGNGQMVKEWKAGLAKAGVSDDNVTVESYFNHQEEPSDDVVDRIAGVIRASSLTPAQ